jgi:flagellar biosynthesis/type III secretory pathway protein FliH
VLVERLLLVVGEEEKEEIVTAGETLIARGRKQGREQGREEGREEGLEKGRAEARREMLLEQLHARFGRLPRSVPERVQAADTAQVKRWLLRVVTATTLAEVFADP